MNRIFVTGYKGKLGSLLLKREGFVAFDCDITDLTSIKRTYKKLMVRHGDLLVNCAGMSSIDGCEKDEVNAFAVNVTGLALLHEVFGEKVLNISTDQVFSGKWSLFPRTEKSSCDPVNVYGFSKICAEAISNINGGKTIRLSRTVSIEDTDIAKYLMRLYKGEEILVPNFFYRNYLTRSQAVDGIEYFARNFDAMPSVVQYGSKENIAMDKFMQKLATAFGLNSWEKVLSRDYEIEGLTPRPHYGGFSVTLSHHLGFPKYSIQDVVGGLAKSANVE